jgi:hypothetical protein
MLNSDVVVFRSRLALTYVRQVTHVLHRQVSQLPSMESKRALPVKPALADSARADLPVWCF